MRIADIVKQNAGGETSEKEAKRPSKTTREKEFSKPEVRSTKISETSLDEFKMSLKKDLEQQFQRKAQEEQERIQEKEKELEQQTEKLKKLSAELEEKERKEEEKRNLEHLLEQKLEAQRKQFEEQMQRQAQESQQEVQQLRDQLKYKETELKQQVTKSDEGPEAKVPEKASESLPPKKKRITPEPPPPKQKTPATPPSKPIVPAATKQGAFEHFPDTSHSLSAQERALKYERLKARQERISEIQETYKSFAQIGDQVTKKIAEKKDSSQIPNFKESISEIITLAEKYDGELLGIAQMPYPDENYLVYHAVNSMILAIGIGMDLELPKEDMMDLALAAFFHDIALVNMQDELDYPKELNKKIKKEVLEHPERSAQMMKETLSDVAVIGIQQHHELCNGMGYPKGTRAKEIGLIAKAISVVDAFEAMTHYRPYRKQPLPVSEAMKHIVEFARGAYDRRILKALMGRVGIYPVMGLVELSNKQVARVLQQNKKHPLSPVVRIEFDEWGHKLKKTMILDLSESRLIHVVGSLEEVDSYQTTRVAKKKEEKQGVLSLLSQFLPLAIMTIVLAIVFYIILKV